MKKLTILAIFVPLDIMQPKVFGNKYEGKEESIIKKLIDLSCSELWKIWKKRLP